MISINRAVSRVAAKRGVQACALFAAAFLGLSAAPHAQARLLVSDVGSHSVNLYNAGTGVMIDQMIPQGTGGLLDPNSMAYGPDGNLYVTDTTNVLRYNGLTGTFLDVFIPAQSGGLDTPTGLAFGPDGNLYVASYMTNSIVRYDGHTGAFIDVFVTPNAGGLRDPYGLAFGPDHNLYVVDSSNSSVIRYNGGTGAFLDAFVPAHSGGLSGALDLIFGPDGNLYISSYYGSSIFRYSGQTGAFIDLFVPAHSGGLSQPEGLTFAPDGNLYVASLGTHSVLRYNGHTGAFLSTFITAGASPTTPRFLLFTLDAPSGLTSKAVSFSQIDLSWTDNSDDETAFAIWRKDGSADWARVGVVPPNVTTFSDTSVAADSQYIYRVRAISNIVASSWSNEANVKSWQAPPRAPFSLGVSAVSTTQITLNWFDNSNNETAFAIWRKSGAGNYARVGVVAPNTTAYTDFGLNPATTYTYRVRATNDFYASDWTNEAAGTTLGIPAPAAPTGLSGSVLGIQVTLSWTNHSNNETAYEIYRKTGSGSYTLTGVIAPNSTSYIDLNTAASTTYSYRVRAANDFWASDLTNEITVTTGTQGPVAAPTGLTASALSSTRINLSWTDHSNNETAFEVYRKTGSGSYALVGVLAPNSTSFADTGASAGTSYSYRVRAANDFFASAFTNDVSVTTGP